MMIPSTFEHAEHTHMNHMHKFSMRIFLIFACPACEYDSFAHAQNAHRNKTCGITV